MSDTYTPAELAEMLDVSKRHIEKQAKAGRLPFPVLFIGGSIRIPKVPVNRALGLDDAKGES